MDYLPIFLDLKQQDCLVVGGGSVATRKVKLLLKAQAEVSVVSPEISDALGTLVKQGQLRWVQSTFKAEHITDQRLIIAATKSSRYILQPEKEKKDLPSLYIDLSVPRNIHPEIIKGNDRLYNIDSLQELLKKRSTLLFSNCKEAEQFLLSACQRKIELWKRKEALSGLFSLTG